jgi:hypothetical protein
MDRKMVKKFVICINNKGHEVSLEKGKVYHVVEDESAAQNNLIRIIDESGEDYLFQSDCFVPIKLPKVVQEALVA